MASLSDVYWLVCFPVKMTYGKLADKAQGYYIWPSYAKNRKLWIMIMGILSMKQIRLGQTGIY